MFLSEKNKFHIDTFYYFIFYQKANLKAGERVLMQNDMCVNYGDIKVKMNV